MKKQYINPPTLFDSSRFGFSQVVIAEKGKLVFVSGQVALNENMELVGENDLETQTDKALDNLRLAVESAGGSVADIVSIRLYMVDYQSTDSKIISNSLKKIFGTINQPASTWIHVKGLANESFMIEIEAQAVI